MTSYICEFEINVISLLRKFMALFQLVGAVSFFFTLMTYVNFAEKDMAISANGTVAAGIAVVLMASPLANLRHALTSPTYLNKELPN